RAVGRLGSFHGWVDFRGFLRRFRTRDRRRGTLLAEFQRPETERCRDLMRNDIIPFRRKVENKRATATWRSTANEDLRTGLRAGGATVDDLQDDFVFSLAQTNAESDLRFATAAAHKVRGIEILEVGTWRFLLVFFGRRLWLFLAIHRLLVGLLLGWSWWRRWRRRRRRAVHHFAVEPHLEPRGSIDLDQRGARPDRHDFPCQVIGGIGARELCRGT